MARNFIPEGRETDRPEEPPTPEGSCQRLSHEIRSEEQPANPLNSERERESSRSLSHDYLQPNQRMVIYGRNCGYRLTARQISAVIDIGKFRAIDENDLLKHIPLEPGAKRDNAIEALVRQGLVRRGRFEGPEGPPRCLVTLTKPGHRLLRANRLVPPEQPTYSGFVKPRDANHDADLYLLYQKEAARIEAGGGRVRRVLLDYEIKRKLNRDIARMGAEARPEIAAHHGLTVVRNKIPVPDMQIEYEAHDGTAARVNLELVTEHYRARHIEEKARAGFALYTLRGEGDHLRRVLDQQELTAEILSL